MINSFLQDDAWTGGNVDALMFFGPATVDDAANVCDALWSFPRLAGPFRHRTIDPAQQPLVDRPNFTPDRFESLVGVYTHDDGTQSNFVHTTIIDDDGLWVCAGPTVGSLPVNWNVGAYPFEDGRPIEWLPSLFDDLRKITHHVNDSKTLRGTIYGWLTTADCDTLLEAIAGSVPAERWVALDVWDGGSCTYYPPTHLEARMRTDA